MRVLLVDDEKELISAMAERLSFRGIEADFTTSGEEGLRLVGEKTYDLAVLDVKMPGLSGLALMKRLREKSPGMKFIFLTGHSSDADFRACTSEPDVVDYLVKPINIVDLVDKMNSILNQGGEAN